MRPLDFEAGLLLLVPSTPSNATQEQRFLFQTHALATPKSSPYTSLYIPSIIALDMIQRQVSDKKFIEGVSENPGS